jgi:hypothetical protein
MYIESIRQSDQASKNADKQAGIKAEADNWFNGISQPKTGEYQAQAAAYINANPDKYPGGAPRMLSPKQWDEVTATKETLATLDDINQAYDRVRGKIGPLSYRFNELKAKVPGLAAQPDFVEFQRLLTGAKNLEVKRITGAQMSEAEASRLMKGMAEGTLKPADFEAAMYIWKRNADRTLATLQGKKLPPLESTANRQPLTMEQLLEKHKGALGGPE